MHPTKWNALLAVVAASGLFFMGCPKDPEPIPDAGTPVDAGPEDAGPEDAGEEPFFCETDSQCQNEFDPDTVCDKVDGSPTVDTCVPRCMFDDMCEGYQMGLRCEELTGHCILGRGCNDDTNCGPSMFEPNDYCEGIGQPGCRCVKPEPHPEGFGGVCRRRIDVCQECDFDEECGSGPTFTPPGRCRALQGDPNGELPDGGTRKYCFRASVGNHCPCGMTQQQGGLCMPQQGSFCDQVGCASNADCPFGSVCGGEAAGACGLCEPRCRWNFDTKQPDPPGCGNRTCWVDPENLDPESSFFGAGVCRPACVSDAECEAIDPILECRGEALAGGGTSPKRCRPKGECMDDFECPQPLPGAVYLGYCDRETYECKTDTCRTGIDPTTGSSYDDCTSGYKCVNDNGNNICVQQTCLEQGGGRIACPEAHYCCGEDKNMDGVPDGCPPTGMGPDQCYLAGRPPFCQTCESHADCAGLPRPSGSTLPNMCVGIPPQQMGADPVFICGIATHNEWSVDSNNISPAHRGCPARFTPTPLKIRCAANSDCGPNGLCEPDPFDVDENGDPILTCLCDADGTGNNASQCPADPETGIQAVCRHAPDNTKQYCVQSVVCLPQNATVYKPFSPPSSFGCGISPP